MLPKRLFGALLALCLCVTAAPGARAAEITGASLTPPDVSENGLVLHKSAVQRSPHVFDVTLTVTGGGTLAPYTPIDVVLLLDCSASMEEESGGTTRIQAARAAVLELLGAFIDAKIDAHIGIVGYSGTAVAFIELTPLYYDPGSGIVEDVASIAALTYAINGLWKPALEPGTAWGNTYGRAGGRNFSLALEEGVRMLNEQGTSPARYCISITDGVPDVYGPQEKSSSPKAPAEDYMPAEELLQATADQAQQAMKDMARLFAVGLDTPAPERFASPGAAASASAGTLESVLVQTAQSMFQRVQMPVVTDTVGNRFVYQADTAQATLGIAGISADGRTLTWELGAWLPAGQAASLTYTLRRDDPLLEGAGVVVPLNASAVLSCSRLLDSGALTAEQLAFPSPTVLYEAGTLEVFSTGLPPGVEGTQQTAGPSCADCEAFFAVEPPLPAPKGYVLQSVVVDGAVMTPKAFVDAYHYELAVKPGRTVVEYRYARQAPPDVWTYTVEYYVEGALRPEWTYEASVPEEEPLVRGVTDHLSDLPAGYTESPPLLLPYRLAAPGQTLKVYYAAPPSPDAQLVVNSAYYLNGRILEGTRTEAPSVPAGNVAVITLLNGSYGGREYKPVSVALTRTGLSRPEDAFTEKLPVTGSFIYEDGYRYVLDAVFDRTVKTPQTEGTNAQVTPVEPVGNLPQTGPDSTAINLLVGVLAGLGSLVLIRVQRRQQ